MPPPMPPMPLLRPLVLALAAAGFVVVAAAPAPARAESLPVTVLQNDGFTGAAAAAFPAGFAAGDTLAVRLDAIRSIGGVIGVEVVLGGGGLAGARPVTLKIWDDSAQTLEPGRELLRVDTQLGADDRALQTIPLAGIGVSGPIRVGVVLGAAAPPVVGQDTDGTLDADRNLVLGAGVGAAWHRSQADGATGDWIIRAHLAGGASGGGGGDPCPGSPCPAGQRCDLATQRCTAGCNTDADCGGGTCDGLGQCVDAGGGDGGCGCQTRARPVTALVASCAELTVLALVLRRRRRRHRRRR